LKDIYAEDLFSEIFTDITLTKISKAFFRFKIENIVTEIYSDVILENDEIDQFFEMCDTV